MSPSVTWPTAELDGLGRARVLAAALPSAAVAEVTLDAPFRTAWAWVADLPRSVPRFDRDVSGVHVRSRVMLPDGAEQLTATVRNHGVPWPFSIRLERGFCLMEAWGRGYTVVMAAVPEPGDASRTRFVHVEGIPIPGTRRLAPVLQRLVDADMRNLVRLAAAGFPARG